VLLHPCPQNSVLPSLLTAVRLLHRSDHWNTTDWLHRFEVAFGVGDWPSGYAGRRDVPQLVERDLASAVETVARFVDPAEADGSSQTIAGRRLRRRGWRPESPVAVLVGRACPVVRLGSGAGGEVCTTESRSPVRTPTTARGRHQARHRSRSTARAVLSRSALPASAGRYEHTFVEQFMEQIEENSAALNDTQPSKHRLLSVPDTPSFRLGAGRSQVQILSPR